MKTHDFDPSALLEYVSHFGYALESIRFRGRQSHLSSAHLCEQLVLSEESAVIDVNMGLLANCSPLPSYFKKFLEEELVDEEKFSHFVEFFDHHLIKDFFRASLPERFLFGSREEALLLHGAMVGFHSVAMLHRLMELCYPEFIVQVKKGVKRRKAVQEPFLLGFHRLGEGRSLGGIVEYQDIHIEVVLKVDSRVEDSDVFWPVELLRRLQELVIPMVKGYGLYLTVMFAAEGPQQRLSAGSYLGYSSLGIAVGVHRWPIFEGIAT